MKASWLLLLGALLCAPSVLADSFRNCNQDWTAAHSPPSRIVALNQHA
ncbi:MAG: ABC transporter substrate-binding protein, partial [Pseudomonas sp.]